MGSVPTATTVKLAVPPTKITCDAGSVVKTGATPFVSMVRTALELVIEPAALLTTTEYTPTSPACTLVMVKMESLASASGVVLLKYHWYVNGSDPPATTVNVALAPGRTLT